MKGPVRKRLPKPPLKGVKVKGGPKRWQQKLQRAAAQQKRNQEDER